MNKKNDEQDIEVVPDPETTQTSQAVVTQHPQKERMMEFYSKEQHVLINSLAETFLLSGALPVKMNKAQISVSLLAGYEVGLKPVQSVNSFYFVNGKVAIYGNIVIAMVMAAGHDVEWAENCDENYAEVKITRGDNGRSMRAKLTMEQAKARGYYKNLWVTYPEKMLKYRAFGQIVSFLCADVLNGMVMGDDEEDVIVEQEENKRIANKKKTFADAAN